MTLHSYIAQLRSVVLVSALPAGETWKDMMRRIKMTFMAHEIKHEAFMHFLEVLPPHWQGHGFAFAEGAEPFRYFWELAGRYYVRQLTWEETGEFCRLARIPKPR